MADSKSKKKSTKDLFPMHEGTLDEVVDEALEEDVEVDEEPVELVVAPKRSAKSDPAPRSITYTRGPGGSLTPISS